MLLNFNGLIGNFSYCLSRYDKKNQPYNREKSNAHLKIFYEIVRVATKRSCIDDMASSFHQ